MRRRTLDALLTTGGLIVAIVLLVAGGLLSWANNFVDDNVRTQLAAQNIYFPDKGSEQLEDPAVKPYLEKYAGQQLLTGEQAKAYADHYIKVHLDASTGGKTYSELSTISRANPDDEKAAGLVQLAFRGETLRGLLLNAYAFGTMGKIAMYAAWASFVGAAAMIVLSLLGFLHLRRVPVEEEVGAKVRRTPVTATA
ncbi:hypothetical protein N798_16425 [Knoellia flava TL1]|uniref:Aromatic ring-opening dioxygenase LigA n=2 Tax=Knoellia flava TaxID=913969 RepID=A0A8H9FR01_9MICO|nr:hypothetical protein [Knoellia flava]KGN28900.1 hypothetical protein N798_16425 [Knoellia flava TL1]GGB71784.1 hypothetical protein GCM10011314_09000 [Knoellia flava]